MLLPVLRVQADIGEHVDGGFEDKERIAGAHMMETVLLQAPRKGLPEVAASPGAPLVDMLYPALFIPAYEYRVVMLRIFIEEMGAGKMGDHLRIDAACPAQVCKNPPHIGMRGGYDERRFFFWRGCLAGPAFPLR